MTAYFDSARREVTTYASAFKDDEAAFLRAVALVEFTVIADVTRVTGDREFPDDLREHILGDIAVLRVDAGELPETQGRRNARDFRDSELVERLHDRFHELARRRVTTRFGVLTDSPRQNLVMREEWEQEHAVHLLRGESACGRPLTEGTQATTDPSQVTCWLCSLKAEANQKRSGQ
jgi:hypothetical protein